MSGVPPLTPHLATTWLPTCPGSEPGRCPTPGGSPNTSGSSQRLCPKCSSTGSGPSPLICCSTYPPAAPLPPQCWAPASFSHKHSCCLGRPTGPTAQHSHPRGSLLSPSGSTDRGDHLSPPPPTPGTTPPLAASNFQMAPLNTSIPPIPGKEGKHVRTPRARSASA